MDLGCCFAQDIRKLAYDWAPTRNRTAIDSERRFFRVAGDSFRDGGRLEAGFVGADTFDAVEVVWREFGGRWISCLHLVIFIYLALNGRAGLRA